MDKKLFRRHALATAVALALAGSAYAQLSTSTLKGQISSAAGAAPAGMVVTAVNKGNGNSYRTTTLADGGYVLPGLAPGVYEIRVSGPAGSGKTQVVTLQVGETAAVDMTVSTGQEVVITGSAQRQDVRSSEVGTNVSRRLIETLPQVSRNFLSSADLAPGVVFSTASNGNASIQSGAQNFDNVNVFVDGVGQKNNILRGGIAGQADSRGNPFPQSAIAEYKVLTQNYKAEFEQVSSAAVTAITRSGTNEFHGEAYIDRTGTNWRTKTEFEKKNEANGVKLPASAQYQYGFNVGGPIVKDQTHFFFAYDGKSIETSRQFVPKNLDKFATPLAGLVPGIAASAGSQVNKFTEHLIFGKVDTQLSEDQRLSVSLRLRREEDKLPENTELSMPGNDKNRSNDDTRFDVKHEWTLGSWLSEARVGYEDYAWNPHSDADSPLMKYRVANASPQLLSNSGDVAWGGGSPDAQNRAQKGFFLSEDLTFTGLKGHVIKGGAKFKAMKYDLEGTSRSVDVVETLLDSTTGLPYYSAGLCTGTNIVNGGLNSDQCKIDKAIPPTGTNYKNNQFGLYIQDDWALTKQLEVNLGVRWDLESNMLNNDYVTPADRVAALKALDVARWGITPPAGQTYAQSLAKGGIDIDDYISDGSSRKTYKGAIAPRLGASYDVFGDRASVVFGGFGRSYSRTMANHALDEQQKNAQAGGEIWLIRNDFKMPYADQMSLGFRQALGAWNGEVTYSHVVAKNQFVWFGGNRDANGGYATQSPIDPLWGGPNGFGTLILGDFVGESKTDALFLSMTKPYSRSSGWTATVAYTFSDAKTTHKEWNNDNFDWTYGRPGARGFHDSILVAKNRLVAAGMADTLLPWGLTASAKLTWDDGLPRRITSCAAGWNACTYVKGDAPSFMQVDVGIGKEFDVFGQKITLRADVLNLFDKTNYGGFDDWGGGPVAAGNPTNAVGGDNLNLGKPNSVRGDPRTMRLAMSYKF